MTRSEPSGGAAAAGPGGWPERVAGPLMVWLLATGSATAQVAQPTMRGRIDAELQQPAHMTVRRVLPQGDFGQVRETIEDVSFDRQGRTP